MTPSKAGWRSKVPIMACGAGLFSDGYLNGVCIPNPAPYSCLINVHVALPRLLEWSILYSSDCGGMTMVLINSVLLHLYILLSSYLSSRIRGATDQLLQIGFTGIILGQLSFGFIVDKYSRKTGMLASSIILITFSILASLAKGVGPRVQGIVSSISREPKNPSY